MQKWRWAGGLLATCGTLLNKIYPFLLRILVSSLAETSLGSGWNTGGSGLVRSAMGRHRGLRSTVRAVFQKMAMTASADGLGVGGKRHILIRLQGPLCDFGAEAFKEAGAASQGGHSTQPTRGWGAHVTSTCPQATASPPQSQPQGSRSYEKHSLNHWALWSSPSAKSCQISKAGLFQRSLSQTTAVRVCSRSIKKYYTDVSS